MKLPVVPAGKDQVMVLALVLMLIALTFSSLLPPKEPCCLALQGNFVEPDLKSKWLIWF